MRKSFLAIAVLVLAAVPATAEGVKSFKVKAEFEQVQQDVADAIINRGYVIDYTSHIGAMLDRTSEDVGAAKKIFKAAKIMQFCSAVVSRKAMEDSAANIAYCPYGIFVYETPDAPGEVNVGYREVPATSDSLKAVNTLLGEIVKEATEGQ